MNDNYVNLLQLLKGYETVAVAFSGGVDSTFLLKAAHEALGENVLAVTAAIEAVPAEELRAAQAFCAALGVRQILVSPDVMHDRCFTENPPDRCYHCKKMIFEAIRQAALENGAAVVAEGSNLDDERDYRPGLRAITELGVVSPLRDAGMTKDMIRACSRRLGLETWDKPSCACLASRFAYGERITEEKLKQVEIAEELLLAAGFRQLRVRLHGDLARIELPPAELGKLLPLRESISREFRNLGFRYVTLDLEGYRTGSMNEVLVDGN